MALAGSSAAARAQESGSQQMGAQENSTSDLAAAAQNQIASMISLPLRNNAYFGVTEDDRTANALNIQPVYPISAGDLNVITRTIVPIDHIPDPTDGIKDVPSNDRPGSATGLGDINFSAFPSPGLRLQIQFLFPS